jgi:apolipoprotein N-acyltransferase
MIAASPANASQPIMQAQLIFGVWATSLRMVGTAAKVFRCTPHVTPRCVGLVLWLVALLILRATAHQCLDQRAAQRPFREVR